MYGYELRELKKVHYLPAFVSLPDAIKIFAELKKTPEMSESFFLRLMREMNFSIFVCFIGWNWGVSLYIELINSRDYPKEQADLYSEKAKELYRESLSSEVSQKVNRYSNWGLFAEFFSVSERFINDYVKNGLVCIDEAIIGIRSEHGIDLIESDLPRLALTVADQSVLNDELEWGLAIESVELLGYEDIARDSPTLSEGSADNSVEVSKGDLFIARDDLLVLLELKEDSENTNPMKAQNTNEEPNETRKKGISKDKHNAMTTASNIADSLWRMEQHKDKRISEMANEVYAELHRLGFADQLPEKPDNVTNWIRTVAPEHARKAGRPPKTITPNLK